MVALKMYDYCRSGVKGICMAACFYAVSITSTKFTVPSSILGMSKGCHLSWAGSGTVSSKLFVSFPCCGTGCHGRWTTEGRIRYSQLLRKEKHPGYTYIMSVSKNQQQPCSRTKGETIYVQ